MTVDKTITQSNITKPNMNTKTFTHKTPLKRDNKGTHPHKIIKKELEIYFVGLTGYTMIQSISTTSCFLTVLHRGVEDTFEKEQTK